MKKMIAMAVAGVVAAPIAMAEVSIGGKVEQMFTKDEAGAWTNGQDLRMKLSGSEDLGNGLTAFYKMEMDVDSLQSNNTVTGAGTITSATSYTTGVGTATDVISVESLTQTAGTASAHSSLDNIIGIKGGFGTLVLGQMEDFTESKVMSMTDVTSGAGSVESDNTNLTRATGGVAYVSPAMNGLTLGVAGYTGYTGGTKDGFDATDIALMYANGPLAVNLAVEDRDVGTTAGTVDNITSIGAKYAAGDLTVAATHRSADLHTWGDEDDTSVAITYKMGNNSVALGWNENETSTATATTSTNANVIELKHSFSGRTSAYINFYNTDVADEDTASLGLQTTF